MSNNQISRESQGEPTEYKVDDAELQRAAAALVPFVNKWGLSLNPENLDLMAAAVLRHSRSSDESIDFQAIQDDVNRMIDEDAAAHHDLQSRMSDENV